MYLKKIQIQEHMKRLSMDAAKKPGEKRGGEQQQEEEDDEEDESYDSR